MTKKLLLIVLIISIGLSLNYNQALAALVTCDPAKPAGAGSCDLCALFETIQNVVNFLIELAFAVVIIMSIYGGIRMYFSGSNPSSRQAAIKVITNAIIGLVIVLTSWIIVNTIITFLAKPGSAPTFWTKINCSPSEMTGESTEPTKPEESQKPECTENEKKCDGFSVLKCINGKWETEKVCESIRGFQQTCKNGECVFPEPACNYQRPNDPYRYYCDEKCNHNPGDTATNDFCGLKDGTFQVCCKSAQPFTCTDNQTRCNTDISKCTNQTEPGRFEEICVNGSWQFNQCCKEGCADIPTGSGSICYQDPVIIQPLRP